MSEYSIAQEGFEYVSTKTFPASLGLSCCFRQHRADSHCHYLHGYALEIRMEFSARILDVRNWVVDFGSLKPLKAMLEDTFDHKTLVATDDPMLDHFIEMHKLKLIDMIAVEATGCEATSRLIFEVAEQWLLDAGYGNRVSLSSVEVKEHAGNSAIYRRLGTNPGTSKD